jgi:fatty acid desaturase
MSLREIETAKPARLEWLTLGVIVAAYGALAFLMWSYHVLPWWVIVPLAGYLIALHGSLQHEALHGHPTRNARINELLIFINPSFWFPYRRYRKLHLVHHNDDNLTDPRLDPESYYLLPDHWARLPAPMKQLYTINNTLAGRMILGPVVGILRFWPSEFLQMARGDLEIIKAWLLHALACGVTLVFVIHVCGIPFWAYVLFFAYPGVSFSLIRSFCEHQAAEGLGERTIAVEASPLLALMFLNNNLHIAHHTRPRLAWYELPTYYRAERDRLLARNHGYLMCGYSEIFRRYFFQPKEPVPYPHMEWLHKPGTTR